MGNLITDALTLSPDWDAPPTLAVGDKKNLQRQKIIPARNHLTNLKRAIQRMTPIIIDEKIKPWSDNLQLAKKEITRLLKQDLDREKQNLLGHQLGQPIDLATEPRVTKQETRDIANLALEIGGASVYLER